MVGEKIEFFYFVHCVFPGQLILYNDIQSTDLTLVRQFFFHGLFHS